MAVRSADITDFIDRERHHLVRALVAYGCTQSAADDHCAEACARLWERWEAVHEPRPWVYRVAFNLARSAARRSSHARRYASIPSLPPGGPDAELAIVVRAALDSLPPRERQTIVLRFLCDMSVDQTADVMGCSPGTVKAATSHAIDRLRVQLGPMEVFDA